MTVLEETKNRMKEMQKTKVAELEEIRQKRSEAKAQKDAAERALKEATEKMDLNAFEEAEKTKNKSEIAISMYEGRYDQLIRQEYITEEESDRVIDSLLAFEEELAADFKKAIAEPLRILKELQQEYTNTITDTESTITEWCEKIHENYSSRGQTIFAETGTDRSPQPIPVHRPPYKGCAEALQIKEFTERIG